MKIMGFVFVTLALFSTSASSAIMTYTYTGMSFTNINDNSLVPGSFSSNDYITAGLSIQELGPNAYFSGHVDSLSLSNGQVTLNGSSTVILQTGSDGNPIQWTISLANASPTSLNYGEIATSITTAHHGDFTSAQMCIETLSLNGPCIDFAIDSAAAPSGTWNVSPVPVPAAAWLFGTGLIGMIVFNYRKRKA